MKLNVVYVGSWTQQVQNCHRRKDLGVGEGWDKEQDILLLLFITHCTYIEQNTKCMSHNPGSNWQIKIIDHYARDNSLALKSVTVECFSETAKLRNKTMQPFQMYIYKTEQSVLMRMCHSEKRG